jgi:hypothetical protein
MFVVAYLFLNLLIAIIVDSYQVVKKNAGELFWKQRMLHIHDLRQMKVSVYALRRETLASLISFIRSHL